MPKFKDLASLEAYLQKNIHHVMNRSAELERVLASTMSNAVYDVVYKAYTPEVYQRRGDEDGSGVGGGLADERNMYITSVEVVDGSVRLVFENLTQGNEDFIPIYGQPQDSLHGKFITDTIVEGIAANWYETGEWSNPRDFVGETAKRLRDSPAELVQAIKNGLIAKGFSVK